ncbi:MAG: hypothetical protein AABW83_01150 [Nanoarchaeota archaeon]
MGLEYNLSEINEIQKLKDELAPRKNCRQYVLENDGKAELLEKEEFNSLCRNKDFIDGPFKESLGDGYGEPYNPNRQVFGRLKDGRIVYCELSDSAQEKVKKLLERR